MGKEFHIANEGHLVSVLPPVDLSGGPLTGDVFNMKNYAHASIIIQGGASSGAVSTITVEQCTSAAAANNTAIAFSYYACTTGGNAANSDVLGEKTAATTTGFAMSTTDNIFYVIELDAAQLSDGYNYVAVQFSDAGATQIGNCIALLSGARYGNDQSKTALA